VSLNGDHSKIISILSTEKLQTKNNAKLTTGLFWILRARFAYFKVFRVSSALISAGLMQAEIEMLFGCKKRNS